MSHLQNIDQNINKRPEDYGFCSFSDFRKNKDKWIKPKDSLFQSVDNGSQEVKNDIRYQRYYLDGHLCETIEAVERMANSEGASLDSIVLGGIVKEKVDNGKLRLHVHFMTKEHFERRKTW